MTPPLRRTVEAFLRESLGVRTVHGFRSVAGGDVHRAVRVDTDRGSVFAKWNLGRCAELFRAEVDGLGRLQATGCVRTPAVLGVVEAEDGAALVLEWVEGRRRTEEAAEALGRQLACLHRHRGAHYGLDRDNFLGLLPQRNRPSPRWVEFFRTERLQVQVERAAHCRSLPLHLLRRLDRLLEHLDRWLGEPPEGPSLLHGDLWWGNWMADAHGPVLVDPAVYYGHREVELAFTELFGGFPEAFYGAYQEAWPLEEGYRERRGLYQLYPLLVHVNLFGGGYAAAVEQVLRRYGL